MIIFRIVPLLAPSFGRACSDRTLAHSHHPRFTVALVLWGWLRVPKRCTGYRHPCRGAVGRAARETGLPRLARQHHPSTLAFGWLFAISADPEIVSTCSNARIARAGLRCCAGPMARPPSEQRLVMRLGRAAAARRACQQHRNRRDSLAFVLTAAIALSFGLCGADRPVADWSAPMPGRWRWSRSAHIACTASSLQER